MSLSRLHRQAVDYVIEWVEPEEGILAYRYPMQIARYRMAGKLTVPRLAVCSFVNEGKVADSFGRASTP